MKKIPPGCFRCIREDCVFITWDNSCSRRETEWEDGDCLSYLSEENYLKLLKDLVNKND